MLFYHKNASKIGDANFQHTFDLCWYAFFHFFWLSSRNCSPWQLPVFYLYNVAYSGFTFSIFPQLSNEGFPQRYRSIAWGYIAGISQIGNFITPYIVTAAYNSGINPMIVISFMIAVTGTVPILFLRETLIVSEDQHED